MVFPAVTFCLRFGAVAQVIAPCDQLVAVERIDVRLRSASVHAHGGRLERKHGELDVRERDAGKVELHERGAAIGGVRGIVARGHASGAAVVLFLFVPSRTSASSVAVENLFRSLRFGGNGEQPDSVAALRAGGR